MTCTRVVATVSHEIRELGCMAKGHRQQYDLDEGFGHTKGAV